MNESRRILLDQGVRRWACYSFKVGVVPIVQSQSYSQVNKQR